MTDTRESVDQLSYQDADDEGVYDRDLRIRID
jgi:hypothetical protein